jgi:hypothetical protein
LTLPPIGGDLLPLYASEVILVNGLAGSHKFSSHRQAEKRAGKYLADAEDIHY